MCARMFWAIISLFVPFVGLFAGLYHLGKFKRTIVKRPVYAVFLMVLTIIPTAIIAIALFAPPIANEEVPIKEKTEVVATPTPAPTPTSAPAEEPKTTFDDNISAARSVKVGMTSDEVWEMEEKSPSGGFSTLAVRTVIDFKETEVGGLRFELSDGRYLRLTPEGTDMMEEQYYAIIIQPTLVAASQPTLILFEGTDGLPFETVIWVGRVDCDLVGQLILLSPAYRGFPSGSACGR